MTLSRFTAIGFSLLCLFVLDTSCRHYWEGKVVYSGNEDYIRIAVTNPRRFKRALPLRKGCEFAFNRTKTLKPLNTEFTDPNTPCLKWKCYNSGRLGLLRFKSGCLFHDRCIAWDPYKPDVEKTGLECDERLCRIHWANGVLQYGMVSPVEESHCNFNGSCYAHGEVITFTDNCTTAVCDVLPKFRRWMRRPLWKPTAAGCLLNDHCNTNGTMFRFGQCLQYMCQARVSITQTNLNNSVQFHFQAVAQLQPVVQGCIRHTGGCLGVNESYHVTGCVSLKCVPEGTKYTLKVDSEGCFHKSGCVNVSETLTERCSSHTCHKRKIDNSIDYYFLTRKVTGCANYFDEEDSKCYKEGEVILSTEIYGKAKGCPGAVAWNCNPHTKTIIPRCKVTK